MKFFFHTEYGEIADLAAYLQNVEGHKVLMHIESADYRKVAEGIVEHSAEWWRAIGEGYIWVFDGCAHGDLQDWLRSQGEWVVGGTKETDNLENDRQKNQAWFRELGFDQPVSRNFTDFDAAIAFVESHSNERFIMKQNGEAPKSLSRMGKFEGNRDLLFHLYDMQKTWVEHSFGPVDFDLMEVVEGTEIAASAFFNGERFLKNEGGKIVGFLSAEEKKEVDGALGETTGEMGTTFYGVTEDSELLSSILLRPGVAEYLAEHDYRGIFDINCILCDDGRLVALEPTCRFGIPSTAYEFIQGLDMPAGELLEALAKGVNRKIAIHEGLGMVMVVAAKPFPIEAPAEEHDTSLGEHLWILEDGEPVDDFNDEQRRRIGLYNFECAPYEETGEMRYRVCTKSGYMLTVTGRGSHISTLRDEMIHWIKENIYLAGMKYRSDIGKRVEHFFERELENDAVSVSR